LSLYDRGGSFAIDYGVNLENLRNGLELEEQKELVELLREPSILKVLFKMKDFVGWDGRHNRYK
jgi:hypothetical protein